MIEILQNSLLCRLAVTFLWNDATFYHAPLKPFLDPVSNDPLSFRKKNTFDYFHIKMTCKVLIEKFAIFEKAMQKLSEDGEEYCEILIFILEASFPNLSLKIS